MGVSDPDSYKRVIDDWSARNAAWVTANPVNANATIVFNVHDSAAGSIDDCYIGILDAHEPGLNVALPTSNQDALVRALLAVTPSLQEGQPIHNTTEHGSYSFYVNVPQFNAIAVHLVTLLATNPGTSVTYGPLNYTVDHATVEHLVFANQFTYVDLTLPRLTDETFALFNTSPIDITANWPPFSKVGRIV